MIVPNSILYIILSFNFQLEEQKSDSPSSSTSANRGYLGLGSSPQLTRASTAKEVSMATSSEDDLESTVTEIQSALHSHQMR